MPLRKFILSLMEGKDFDVNNKEIAEQINVHTSTISNFLNYKLELKFEHILDIIRIRDGGNEKEHMDYVIDYFISDNKSPRSLRFSMEYLSLNRGHRKLEQVIQGCMNSANKETKEWAVYYDLLHKYQTSSNSLDSLKYDLTNLKTPKSPEMKVLRLILEIYFNYALGHFTELPYLIKQANQELTNLKPSYVKQSFNARVIEILSRYHLYCKSDSKKAIKYSKMILEQENLCARFKLNSYHTIGTALIFESFEESAMYFKKYKEELIKRGYIEKAKEAEERDLHFLRVLWGAELDVAQTSDPNEKVFFEALRGDKQKAIQLISNGYSSPFLTCFEGIAKNDPNILAKSVAEFINKGNKFFAQLPEKFLKEMSPSTHATINILLKNLNIA